MAGGQWSDVDLGKPLYTNVDEALVSDAATVAENCYLNSATGWSRFPGIRSFITGLEGRKVYVYPWRNDLYAATDRGRIYRFDKNANATDITGVPLSGGARPVFAPTEDTLTVAAGGAILHIKDGKTDLLSSSAPFTTHVAYIGGYLVAIEPDSGRFQVSENGAYDQWDPLDTFSAEGKPDNLNAALVTPFNELLLAGPESIEQFETSPSAAQPLSRRWTASDGLMVPYTLVANRYGTYGVNGLAEFVRFQLQSSTIQSADIQVSLESVDDWSDAWATEIAIKGHRFLVLVVPKTTNTYGTRGVAFAFDYLKESWSTLYGWSNELNAPVGWPVFSYCNIWGRHFVGIDGGIGELTSDVYDNLGAMQRVVVRSGHMDKWMESEVHNFHLRLRRGVAGSNATQPYVGLRVNRDNRGFGRIKRKPLGLYGDREMTIDFGNMGYARTWQFEIVVMDAARTEIKGAKALVQRTRN